MELNVLQIQTLRNIYEAADCSCARIRYSAKQLAPHTSKSGATAFFNALEERGLVERFRSKETGHTFAIELTEIGVEILINHYAEIWPPEDLAAEVRCRLESQRRILPDLLEEAG